MPDDDIIGMSMLKRSNADGKVRPEAVRELGNKLKNEKAFALKQTGDKFEGSVVKSFTSSKYGGGGPPEPVIDNKPCDIELSLGLRKKEPGESITSVVKNPNDKKVEIHTFKLKIKGQ